MRRRKGVDLRARVGRGAEAEVNRVKRRRLRGVGRGRRSNRQMSWPFYPGQDERSSGDVPAA
jgi:hypothetical protein